MKFTVIAVFALFLILPIKCNRINSKAYEEILMENQNHIIDIGSDSEQTQDQLEEQPSQSEQKNKELGNMLAYVKTAIPIRIFQCMQRLNILKCMKIFILQRMERSPIYPNTGNVTTDFLDQILSNNQNNSDDSTINEETLDKYYLQMSEVEINERLLKSFQRFFHDREIKLHFIPGMVVKVVPNEENAINLSLKRGNLFYIFHLLYAFDNNFLYSSDSIDVVAAKWPCKESPRRLFTTVRHSSNFNASYSHGFCLTIHSTCLEICHNFLGNDQPCCSIIGFCIRRKTGRIQSRRN